MKNRIIFIAFCLISVSFINVHAQLIEGESAYVYALPKTELKVEVVVTKTMQIPGEFYQYSQRYLGTSNVITQGKTTYEVKEINVSPVSVPNPDQIYSLSGFDKKTPAYNISVNEQGILCGINNPFSSVCKEGKKTDRKPSSPDWDEGSSLLPLGEEYMMAGSTAKLAEGTAKQIYRIRESRLNLLTGDVDHMPADGNSMNTILTRLDKMEKELTELFIGKTIVETEKHVITYDPAKAQANDILFRLSAVSGIVSANDLSGAPYYIRVNAEKAPQFTPAGKKPKSNTVLYYVLPVSGTVVIDDTKKQFYSNIFVFPQFGTVTTLNDDVIKNKSIKVRIDPQTGRLLDVVE